MLSLCTSWGTAGRRLALSALSEAARRVAQPGLSVVPQSHAASSLSGGFDAHLQQGALISQPLNKAEYLENRSKIKHLLRGGDDLKNGVRVRELIAAEGEIFLAKYLVSWAHYCYMELGEADTFATPEQVHQDLQEGKDLSKSLHDLIQKLPSGAPGAREIQRAELHKILDLVDSYYGTSLVMKFTLRGPVFL